MDEHEFVLAPGERIVKVTGKTGFLIIMGESGTIKHYYIILLIS